MPLATPTAERSRNHHLAFALKFHQGLRHKTGLTFPADGNLEHVVRFFTIPGGPTVTLFYSDNGDGVDAPADTGLPINALTNAVLIQEVGPEGANGATYTPTAGQPGFFNTDFTFTYDIVSDSGVPEPASMMLMGAGIVALAAFKRYRR